jgi:hypothetical protein
MKSNKAGHKQAEFTPFATLRGSSTGVVARVESLRERMGAPQSTRQVEGLFESLLAEAFS